MVEPPSLVVLILDIVYARAVWFVKNCEPTGRLAGSHVALMLFLSHSGQFLNQRPLSMALGSLEYTVVSS